MCVFGSGGWSKNRCGGVVVCFKACEIILGVGEYVYVYFRLSLETFD